MYFVFIMLVLGVASGMIGRGKGSPFWLWFGIGFLLPFVGLLAAVLYRVEHAEPERRCPNCDAVLKLYIQVCSRCGEDLYLPEPSEVTAGPAYRA